MASRPETTVVKKKRKAPLVIGCLVVCLVVCAAVLALAVFLGAGGDLQGALSMLTGESPSVATASYASDEVVDVSLDTAIVPNDASDNPLSSYVVRVIQADSLEGTAIDPATLPNLSVDGSGGFSLSGFGAVESGTYYLRIISISGDIFDLPPVRVGDTTVGQDDLPETLEVSASSAGGSLSRQGKYASYLGVLDGLIEAYGDASLGVLKLDDDRYESWVAGVSYADLVDFGDGVERLVVMYCTNDVLAQSEVIELEDEDDADGLGPVTGDYQIEVWEYDSDADDAVMVYQLKATAASDDDIGIAYLTDLSTGHMCLYANGSSLGSSVDQCYGIDDDGTFGSVAPSSTDFDRWTLIERYLVSHSGTTQDAALSDAGSRELSCEETAQTVKDLAAKLQTICKA